MLDHMVTLHLTFGGIAKLFVKSVAPFYILTKNYEGSSFSTSSTTRVYYLFFLVLAILVGCEVLSHCGFDLHSLMANDVEHLFSCF